MIGGGTALDDAWAFGQWNAARRLVERGARPTLLAAAAWGWSSARGRDAGVLGAAMAGSVGRGAAGWAPIRRGSGGTRARGRSAARARSWPTGSRSADRFGGRVGGTARFGPRWLGSQVSPLAVSRSDSPGSPDAAPLETATGSVQRANALDPRLRERSRVTLGTCDSTRRDHNGAVVGGEDKVNERARPGKLGRTAPSADRPCGSRGSPSDTAAHRALGRGFLRLRGC